ncbi:MAG: TraR/DksA family transcriptional regulator [Thermodesulfovibrionales bacterium]
MDPMRKSNLTSLLLSKKDKLLNISRKEMNGFINGDSRKAYGSGNEDGDVSLSLQIEDVSISAMKIRNETLKQIEHSLMRLRDDEYGICEECGEEIDEKRLHVVPFAILCRDCQEAKELAEKVR